MLDFTRAFDTIDHSLLLAILHYLMLEFDKTKTFRSYFTNSNNNKIISVKHEMPQGFILGPLLFTLYTSVLVPMLCKI